VVESAPVKAIFARPRHPYTRGLMRSLPSFDKAVVAEPVTRAKEGEAALDQPRRARLPVIEGLVPDLLSLPPGCRFADRCPMVVDECRTAEPSLEPIEGSTQHLARCIRSAEV